MIQSEPKISVCIPAYNRASVLSDLPESALSQNFEDFELVINEDCSPERDQIREIVERFISKYPEKKIKYHENQTNLGYDANLRDLIERSSGAYCVFMGNDDLMCPNALQTITKVIDKYPNVGVYLRSFATFEDNPKNIIQHFKYFDKEIFFPSGASTITTFYKRSVVIPGVTLHRISALKYSSGAFDGSLLYQIYLIANILVDMNGVFSPETVTLYRNGGVPDFGNSEAEKGKFVPKTRTIESSINFMKGMLKIAHATEISRNVKIYKSIVNDLSNYSYPILSVQADKRFIDFFKYYIELIKLGLGKRPLFHLYFISIVLLGVRRMEFIIGFIKQKLGYTPALGSVYKGHRQQNE